MTNRLSNFRYTSLFLLAITLQLAGCSEGSSSSSGGGSCADSLTLVVSDLEGNVFPSGGVYSIQSFLYATVTVSPNPGAGVDVEISGEQFGGSVTVDSTDVNGVSSKLAFLFGRFGSNLVPRSSGYVEKVVFSSSCISVEWIGTVQ